MVDTIKKKSIQEKQNQRNGESANCFLGGWGIGGGGVQKTLYEWEREVGITTNLFWELVEENGMKNNEREKKWKNESWGKVEQSKTLEFIFYFFDKKYNSGI